MNKFVIVAACLGLSLVAWANEKKVPPLKKVFVVVLENEDRRASQAQPYLKELAKEGAELRAMSAITHPSQPNYIALVSGDLHGVDDNDNHDLDAKSLADLLEARKKSWKLYAEGFPSPCFQGARSKKYVRKHNPFISFKSIQSDAKRCARIVASDQLALDIAKGDLANFSLYIPDLDNDGHDRGVKYADAWLRREFGPRLKDPRFTKDLLFVVTFDENDGRKGNQIYTVFWGHAVRPSAFSNHAYDLYSLLRTFEEGFSLPTLGLNDSKASPITDIWK